MARRRTGMTVAAIGVLILMVITAAAVLTATARPTRTPPSVSCPGIATCNPPPGPATRTDRRGAPGQY